MTYQQVTSLFLATAAILSPTVSSAASPSNQADQAKWSIRPYIGFSQMSDITADTTVGEQTGTAEIDLDSGFTAGFGVAYQINSNWSTELAWEYRSNDSETLLPDGTRFTEGNYAANLFALNALYSFTNNHTWTPYLGAGLTWLQEIDIDLEANGIEQSYSGDGDTGIQVFAGVNYPIKEHWALQGEIRYGNISGLDLSGEEGAVGNFTDMDYTTTTLQVGITYKF